MAAWAPLVPYAKDRLAVDDGTLGLLLLCLGVGSIAAMPLSGALAARFGCRRVIWAASLVMCAALPLLATAGSVPLLAAALMLFGAGVGTVDVAMNVQAVIVERAAGRAVMSGFHGLFSVGGIAGAAGVGAVLWAGGSPLLATLCVAAVIVAALLVFGRALLPYGGDRDGRPSPSRAAPFSSSAACASSPSWPRAPCWTGAPWSSLPCTAWTRSNLDWATPCSPSR